jgi:phospholipid transport system transporter-binding protein
MTRETDKAGAIPLPDQLTFDSVNALWAGHPDLSATDTIDLAGIKRVDSAGLALLLEWQASARVQGRTLSFSNAPRDLVRLAALCEASDLLGLEAP